MHQLWIVIEHFHMDLKSHRMKIHQIHKEDKAELVKDMFLSKLLYCIHHLRVNEELDAIMWLYHLQVA